MHDAQQIAELLRAAGPLGLLVLVAIMVWRRKLYLEREYEAMREDRDFWRNAAVTAMNIGEAAVKRGGER